MHCVLLTLFQFLVRLVQSCNLDVLSQFHRHCFTCMLHEAMRGLPVHGFAIFIQVSDELLNFPWCCFPFLMHVNTPFESHAQIQASKKSEIPKESSLDRSTACFNRWNTYEKSSLMTSMVYLSSIYFLTLLPARWRGLYIHLNTMIILRCENQIQYNIRQ